VLELSCPQALEGQQLLYVTKVTGLSNCTSNYTPNSQGLEVRTWSWCGVERWGYGTMELGKVAWRLLEVVGRFRHLKI
jgi:hypothetical protein